MEQLQEQLQIIIDDIESNEKITNEEILLALNILKAEMEDYTLGHGESSLQWEDLE
tara:strand:+ start:505 stop:672 length:168 start_codon:yes stop_codon:yes gene_type:complete